MVLNMEHLQAMSARPLPPALVLLPGPLPLHTPLPGPVLLQHVISSMLAVESNGKPAKQQTQQHLTQNGMTWPIPW